RGKIEATINNAKMMIELVGAHGSFYAYLQQFCPQKRSVAQSIEDIPSVTDESKALSKDLKKQGFKFVGPTTCYAFMQAMGMVDDHIDGCDFKD
ncbi:MAG: DNA-3-methyladenine glycosylase I, partial [Bdellovibrionales bacterium]